MKKEEIELTEEHRLMLQYARNATFRVALDLMDKGLEDMGADAMRLALKFGKAAKAKKTTEMDARQMRLPIAQELDPHMEPAEFQEDGIGEGPDMAPSLEGLEVVEPITTKKRGAKE